MDYALIRFGEIAIKGPETRKQMIRLLIKNIQLITKPKKTENKYSRIIIKGGEQDKLNKISGIVSYSKAQKIEKLTDVLEKIKEYKPKNFKVNTQRIDKTHKKTSQEVNEDLGALIVEKYGWKVKLQKPELEIGIEIINGEYYFYTETERGVGGLPTNPKEVFTILIKNQKDLDAAKMIIKRGLQPVIVEGSKMVNKLQEWTPYTITKTKEYGEVIVTTADINEIKKLKTKGLVINPLIGLPQ